MRKPASRITGRIARPYRRSRPRRSGRSLPPMRPGMSGGRSGVFGRLWVKGCIPPWHTRVEPHGLIVPPGRSIRRRSTASWWRSTMISRSFERPDRTARRASAAMSRYKMRYTRLEHRRASSQVNGHDRIFGTHGPLTYAVAAAWSSIGSANEMTCSTSSSNWAGVVASSCCLRRQAAHRC